MNNRKLHFVTKDWASAVASDLDLNYFQLPFVVVLLWKMQHACNTLTWIVMTIWQAVVCYTSLKVQSNITCTVELSIIVIGMSEWSVGKIEQWLKDVKADAVIDGVINDTGLMSSQFLPVKKSLQSAYSSLVKLMPRQIYGLSFFPGGILVCSFSYTFKEIIMMT